MRNAGEVAVFWDYENCPAPTNTSGYAIVNNIRSIAQSFGSVKLLKAYLEVSEQAPVSRALVLRSELQASGVSLTECPQNGRKDVADKMILVDMLAHAIDNPAPSTIVLISGDRDFAYALSILRLRHYRIVLITLSNAHQSLRAQASLCFDWNSDVLESVIATSSHLPTSPRRGKASSPQVHGQFYSETRERFPVWEPYDETSASSARFTNYFQDATRPREDSRTPSKHDTRHAFLPPDLELYEGQPDIFSVASDTLRSGPESSARVIHSPAASSCSTYLNDSIETPHGSAPPNTPARRNPKLPTYASATPSRSSTRSTLRESGNSPKPEQHEFASEKPMSIESAIQMRLAEIERSSPSCQKLGSDPLINIKAQGLSSVDQMADNDSNSPPAQTVISPLPNITPTLSTPAPSSTFASSLSSATVTAVAQGSVKAANSRRLTPILPVPDKFKVLVQCLKTHRSRGGLRPLRSQISSEISHNGTTYRQAGVSNFDEYIAMAEKAGFVELGSSQSTAWIALKAPWFNVPNVGLS